MNPSTWNNPPPPGIDLEEEENKILTVTYKGEDYLDQIDPYIKNPEYIKYKKSLSKERCYRRSRSRSNDRHKPKKRHRSRSKNRHRCSRTRSKERRRKRCASSSSSSSHEKNRYRSKQQYSSRARKYSRSRSKSRDNKHRRRREIRHKSRSHSQSDRESFVDAENIKKEEEDIDEPSKENAYKNDGSFLEMFKKMQEEKIKTEADANEASGSTQPKKLLPTFGKRRGGRVLKTGMVEKTRLNDDDDESGTALDPWSIYLKEVKKYKEACCDDDSKTRPLVK